MAQVDSTVLITGESGTGKERIARLVHDASARAAGPFIAVNCGAITETLPRERAVRPRPRRVHRRGAASAGPLFRAAANGGTLLLDEIGEVSPGMQVKLLRALQAREDPARRRESQPPDRRPRVIAATNSDLTPARHRRRSLPQDPLLPAQRRRAARAGAARAARRHPAAGARAARRGGAAAQAAGQRPVAARRGSAAALFLAGQRARQLENAMERAVALASESRTDLLDLPEEVRQAVPVPSASSAIQNLEDVERDYILAILKVNDGNQARTAEMLDIGTATLYRKLKKYGALRGK